MKLLIIDDEERTREMLYRHITWGELGIHEVETARNGQVALELCRSFRPDIVLCDIRMPKMDGIEFAKRLRESDLSCKLMFMSGFSDKEYLMSAIRLNALDYIEKPINLDKVREAVRKAVESRKHEERKRLEERQLQDAYDEGLPYLRQEMVRKLITVPGSLHVQKALESRETFLIPLEGPYTVIAATLYWQPLQYPEDPKPVQEALLRGLNMNSLLSSLHGICGFDSRQSLIFILPEAFGSSYREQRNVLEELYAEVAGIIAGNIRLRMGVGNSIKERMQIPHSYRTALDACSMHYYSEDSRLIFADALGSNRELAIDWDMVRSLRRLLKQEELEAARSLIVNWTKQARAAGDLDIVRLKDSYFQFLLVILDVAVQLGFTDTDEDTERRYIWKEIDRVPNLASMEEYILSFLDLFLLPQEPEGNSAKMREILQYIHKRFDEKGFTIPDIADHVSLNETYLCSLFKKQRGSTIKEYISSLRVEKAKELLLDKELKLYEVADRTGFTDANYFTTFFKKYAGCTPSEYRERMAK
ncbi:AraC family transcriptional regulator [Paenibacillus helianthi]|uniref:AraC family transcriptional regulator n=1 Tax=Paenibacillus helianthi TaxID=1349432 RepID=A0ABX3EFK6_9BACL|nr:response regulator [Paenibacillus helianthi]OKP80494.1 AraC family transcriptional regulator [Paenibacillus helianthi]